METGDSFYQLTFKKPNGEVVSLSEFKGKPILIVNTATKCGLSSQFRSLEELHKKYKDRGLVVLGFPCNQFLNQEPESNETVEKSCEINFGVTFQLTELIDVNGFGAHPIFKFLKRSLGGVVGNSIKWNFTKFLITPNGKPYKRYAPVIKPKKIEKDIIKLI